MAWLEKDHNGHGRQPPDQAAQSRIQRGLECLQGWGINSLLGQPVPMGHHPLCEKLPPNIHPKRPLSQFKTIPPCPITIYPCKQPFPFLFIRSLQVLEGHNEVSPQPSLFQAKQAQFPQLFLIGDPLIILVALLWIRSKSSMSFLYWGPKAWMQYSRWDLTGAEQRGTVTSLSLLASPF